MCALLFSCIWLVVTPWTGAHQAPLSMEFFRQEYWSGLPFPPSADLPGLGIKPASLALQADPFTTEPSEKPRFTDISNNSVPPSTFSNFYCTCYQGTKCVFYHKASRVRPTMSYWSPGTTQSYQNAHLPDCLPTRKIARLLSLQRKMWENPNFFPSPLFWV